MRSQTIFRKTPNQATFVPIKVSECFILFLLAFAAYSTVAWHYSLFADDLVFRAKLPTKFFDLLEGSHEVWRFMSYLLIGEGVTFSPVLFMVSMVLMHVVNGLLLLKILRQLGCQRRLSLWALALFITFPGYHEVVAAAAAAGYVWSTTAFLLSLTLALSWQPGGAHSGFVFFTLLFVVLIGNMFGEQLALACFFMPIAVALWQNRMPWKGTVLKRIWPLYGASLGAIIFVILFQLTSTMSKQISIDPRALLSPVYYQYANFHAYVPWFHLDQLGYLTDFHGDGLIGIAGVALALIFALGMLRLQWRKHEKTPEANAETGSSLFALFAAGALVFFSIYAIFAFGGGYSLDSHKRYDILIGFVLLAVPILARLNWRPGRKFEAIAILFLVVNVATSTLLTAIYKTEIVRHDKLVQSWNELHPGQTYSVEPYRGRETLWKYLEPFWEDFYYSEILPQNLIRIYKTQSSDIPPRVYYDLKSDQWVFSDVTSEATTPSSHSGRD